MRAPDPATKTILVVANETLGGGALLEAARERAAENVRFVLCVPQNRPRAGLVIYDDAVHDAAQARVDLALGVVRANGVDAIGEVGDFDAYSATMDAVRQTDDGKDLFPDVAFGVVRGPEEVVDDPQLTRARLELCRAARHTLKTALELMGVGAPERM